MLGALLVLALPGPVARHAEKKKPNGDKRLNFDTLECGNCKGYVLCLWSAGASGLHDYRVLRWPIRVEKHPEHCGIALMTQGSPSIGAVRLADP